MSLSGSRPSEIKFLVDLEKHTYISDKAHQEIIDHAGLNPAGYDNYLKGWVKKDGTIKIWVETIEDLAFRYWDQIKLAFSMLMKEEVISRNSKTYAVVNRVDRFAGKVQDFLISSSKNQYFENQLGYAVHLYGQPKIAKGSDVLMLVNFKLEEKRYVLAGTRGKVITPAGAQAKKLRVKWQNTVNGNMQHGRGVEVLVDRRLLTLV
jgi:Tfp pilus assembly protein PilZ